MHKRALIYLIALAVVGGLSLSVCADKGNIHVGVTVPHLQSEYWVLEVQGVKEVIKEYGGTVSEFAAENDVSKQINAVENFIQMGVDVIILDPVDSYACIPAVQKANKAGIPVVLAGGLVMGGKYETHVSSDHFEGGKLAAQYLVDQLHGQGKVAMFTYPYTIWGLLREQGAKSVFNQYPGIKIVAEDGNAWKDGGPAGVMAAMENILLANPDLNAVWCYADNPAYNAMKVLVQRRREDIIITGFDGHSFVLDAIKNGSPIKGTYVQAPKEIGRLAAQAAIKIFRGEKVPKSIKVPAKWVTKDDLK